MFLYVLPSNCYCIIVIQPGSGKKIKLLCKIQPSVYTCLTRIHYRTYICTKIGILLPDTPTNHHPEVPFIELPVTDSTNNYAMQLVHKGLAVDGMVCFAHRQTAGKGQRGKQWQSEPGSGITMSMLLKPNRLPVSMPFVLSMITALAAYDFFEGHALSETSVKWPNDIYWRDRKAGGILIENLIKGREWQWAIVGIGININQVQFDAGVTKAVSLKQITGKTYDPVALAKSLAEGISGRLTWFYNNGADPLLEAYHTVLYKKGQSIRLRRNNIVFDAVLKKVDLFGRMHVERGTEEQFSVGEVEWMIS